MIRFRTRQTSHYRTGGDHERERPREREQIGSGLAAEHQPDAVVCRNDAPVYVHRALGVCVGSIKNDT